MILKHKTGLISKNRHLDKIMLQDNTVDPLSGNYTLLEQNGISAAFQGLNNQLTIAGFTTNPGGSKVQIQKEAIMQWGDQNPGKHVAMTSGDFNGDGKAELAIIILAPNGSINLQMAVYNEGSPSSIIPQGNPIPIGTCFSPNISANTGYINDNQLSLILSWSDEKNNLQFWIAAFDQHLSPTKPVTAQGPSLTASNFMEVSTGIITGTSNNELVVFYQGATDNQGNDLYINIYEYSATAITLLSQTKVGALGGPTPVISLVTGSFLASTVQDGIVVAWTDTSKTNFQTFIASDAKGTLTKVYGTGILPSGTQTVPAIRMACGDLNNDGVEELVIGITCSSAAIPGYLHLQLYNFTNTLTPQLQSEAYLYGDDTYKFIAFDFQLAVTAFLENNTGSGIVIGTLGADNSLLPIEGYARVSIGVVQVDPDLKFPVIYQDPNKPAQLPGMYSEEDAYDSSKVMKLNLVLSLGDYSGNNINVGKPVYKALEDCTNVLAVINMLPLQSEINNEGQVSFNQMQSKATSLGLKTNRNYTTSNTLEASLGFKIIGDIGQSITNTYGENFSKSFEKFDEITQNLNVLTMLDDFLLLAVNDFDTWEYPVYSSNSNTISGYILLIFPTANVKRHLTVGGLNFNSYYRPRHILGNVLSYNPMQPADFNPESGSYCNQNIETGSIQVTVDANWTNSTTSSLSHEVSQEQSVGTSVSLNGTIDLLGGISMGLDYQFQDDYTQSTTSTYEIEYMESTNISMVAMPLISDPTTAYEIVPYVYWSNPGGYIKLDYVVNIPNGSTYYQQHYSVPDPSFHLCWANPSDKMPADNNPMAEFTRDLNFVPSTTVTGAIDIQVTVHNDTLGTQGTTTVAVYNGDPRNNGVQIGTTQTISSIGPRGFEMISINDIWKPVNNTDYKIYAVIDPGTTLKKTGAGETIALNKIGFGCYPVTNISSLVTESMKGYMPVKIS